MHTQENKVANLQISDTKILSLLSKLKARSMKIDEIIASLGPLPNGVSLFATGGYGRKEMFPHSDVDLLFLSKKQIDVAALEQFIQKLWDEGLKVSHSVRTVAECEDDALNDLSFLTALLEARPLAGDSLDLKPIVERTKKKLAHQNLTFLKLKLEEQFNRHEKYNDNLEPNLKNCPGGLRDVQMIAWLALYYFNSSSAQTLITEQLITADEYQSILVSYAFIAQLRYDLHLKCQRAQDVLLFDDQKYFSKSQGYIDTPKSLAVEQLMKRFYREAANISFYNELFLQTLEERFNTQPKPQILDDDFQRIGQLCDIRYLDLYQRNPSAIFKTFLILGNDIKQSGYTARTLRALKQAGAMIDEDFRSDPLNQQQFVEVFQMEYGVTRQINRMNRLNLISAFMPIFDDIKGHMQFDLFHRHTVDEHTIQVIKELRRISLNLSAEELPFATDIFLSIDSPYLLYIAAFYHDLGKGRGVDHSHWGAEAILTFCEKSHFTAAQTALLQFLVQEHLLMSLTAQKMDLSDPVVIRGFAERVQNVSTLNYLYLLTVADIRATNISLWNGWKESLLRTLYLAAKQFLKTQQMESAEDAKRAFLATHPEIHSLANDLSPDYWRTFSTDECLWQLSKISTDLPCISAFRENPSHHEFELFIALKRKTSFFAQITGLIDKHNLSIAQAQFYSTPNDVVLSYFVILQSSGDSANSLVMNTLNDEIQKTVLRQKAPRLSKRRTSQKLLTFKRPTKTLSSIRSEQNRLEFFATDRPGLLAEVGKVFAQSRAIVHQARITTLGDRVEDVFYITDRNRKPFATEAIDAIKAKLLRL